MNEAAIIVTEPAPLWRRILDFPLVAMLIAAGLFILSAKIGQAIGSSVPLNGDLSKMLVRNAIILTVVLLTYKLAIARLGENPGDDLGAKRALPDLGIGIAIGFVIMSLSVGVAAIADLYDIIGEGDASQLMHALVTAAIMPAFMEELLFRGILFRWIETFGGSWVALIITSALFGAAHLANPHASAIGAVGIAIEAGLLLGGAYMLTRSLWLPIGVHAAWNFSQGEIYDIPVSGTPVHGLLNARLSGAPLLTGNGFGLEASPIAIVVATVFGVILLSLAIKRGQLMQPWWVRRRSAQVQPLRGSFA